MIAALMSTPFHARTAARNPANAWVPRGGFTVPAHYGDPQGEALAAYFSAVLADLTPIADLRIHGAGAGALIAAACRSDVSMLGAGQSRAVHWLADGGGVRGLGTVSCFGPENFLLRSAEADGAWFATAAPRFGATVREATFERGLLWLAGPFAFAVLAAAGLEDAARLIPGEHRLVPWRGRTVNVLRALLRGYQIGCANTDAADLFDGVVEAGRLFGLRLAGVEALDVLSLEAGLVIAGRDFTPARAPFAREPLPTSLGLGHADGAPVLAGIALDGDVPAPFAPVRVSGEEVGRTMRSLYSPALQAAIALASLTPSHATPGTTVQIVRCGDDIAGRVVALPFLR
jgi:glycine cleavage system T protein (aminomethyltransferase)